MRTALALVSALYGLALAGYGAVLAAAAFLGSPPVGAAGAFLWLTLGLGPLAVLIGALTMYWAVALRRDSRAASMALEAVYWLTLAAGLAVAGVTFADTWTWSPADAWLRLAAVAAACCLPAALLAILSRRLRR
jgi:hypothetical protein